jgi:hypothetical protein
MMAIGVLSFTTERGIVLLTARTTPRPHSRGNAHQGASSFFFSRLTASAEFDIRALAAIPEGGIP